MALRIANFAFDCDDVLKVAQFWSAVIDRPIDPGSSPEFASIGGADAERRDPAWYFERVPERKTAKNRMHLDLIGADQAGVEQLVALGATIVAQHSIGQHGWTVMHDPEGNEFCVAAQAFAG